METTCLLDLAGKGRVKTSVHVPLKDITYMSPVHKPVIKGGKGKKSSLLDGGKGIVNIKESDDSLRMANLEGSQCHNILS